MKMKTTVLFLLLAFFTSVAMGSYPNNYATYTTYSLDSTHTYFVVNTSISGTTLPPVPPMSGAYHMAQANAIWNQNGNLQHGPSVCTSCNVNANLSWDFPLNDLCWGLGDCTL